MQYIKPMSPGTKKRLYETAKDTANFAKKIVKGAAVVGPVISAGAPRIKRVVEEAYKRKPFLKRLKNL